MGGKAKYFMWGYQSHFRLHAEIEARTLLHKLDPTLAPQVFLVGFLIRPRPGRAPICVVPEDCPFQPQAFAGVPVPTPEWMSSRPESDGVPSSSTIPANAEQRRQLRALLRAVQEKLESASAAHPVRCFCSWPQLVDDYLVLIVLQVSQPAFDAHYRLRRGGPASQWSEPCRVERSLLEAAIARYLEACAQWLGKPYPAAAGRLIEDATDILRAAAKGLMTAPALAGGNEQGLHGLYESCNAVSTLKYEGTEGVGRLVLARRGHPHIQVELEFVAPIPLREYAAVRKLLQLVTGNLCLLCDSAEVYGIGLVADEYDAAREDVFVIRFVKNFVWELVHADQTLMHVRYGEPTIRFLVFPEDLFRRDAPRLFPGIGTARTDNLCQLARAVAEQEHGAMLVISASAAAEAIRLANQCTRVRPLKLSPAMIPLVTLIDGAVLVDLDGHCHAIGVILDGMASHKCSPSRGARFNSAVRYAYGRADCMAIVKSEDGMVDLLPVLMPQVRRSELESYLKEMRGLAAAEVVDSKDYHRVMNWFDRHRFYLSACHCEELNQLKPEVESGLDPTATRLHFGDFTPDPDLNDLHFLED
jgi:hypothetical protein